MRAVDVTPLPGNRFGLILTSCLTCVAVVDRSAGVPDAFGIEPVRYADIVLSPPPSLGGLWLELVNDPGGPHLLVGDGVYNLDGSRAWSINLAALGVGVLADATYITSGPYAGDYAVLEDRTSRLVIFRR